MSKTIEVQKILWNKIKDFELDDPNSSFKFSRRLANENNWSIKFTFRAIEEYKRFMFLICIADFQLAPSEQVDQVWHLHLLYTTSYWVDFCQKTINRSIHHHPSKGGTNETNKYIKLYERTKALYATVFNEPPPPLYWPNAQIRFAKTNYRRIDTVEYRIFRKKRFQNIIKQFSIYYFNKLRQFLANRFQ